MGRTAEAAYFLALSAAGLYLVLGYAASFPHISDPTSAGQACLQGLNAVEYDFLAQPVNEVLCAFNRVFQALTLSPPAVLLAGQFAALCYPVVVIFAYESFRQSGFLARRGHFFLLLSQLVSAACVFPLYYAIVAYTRTSASMARRPTAPQTWSILLASIIGYLGPTYYLSKEKWSYDSLSIWQIYPIFVMALNVVLPFLLRPFLKNTSPLIPVYLILAISIYLSAKAHFEMLASGVAFQDVFLLFSQPESLAHDAHRLFLLDFLTSTIASWSFVVATFDSASGEHKFGYAWVLMVLVNMVGPGGALAAVWALREIVGVSSLQTKLLTASVKSKKQ